MDGSPPQSDASELAAIVTQQAFDLVAALREHVGGVLDELDLTEALADALWSFDPDGGATSRRDLAARLRCDPSNVTLLADRLEARGYIERSSDVRDRRFKAMRLTPAGTEARARLLSTFVTDSPFARLSVHELRQLSELLGRLLGSSAPSDGTDGPRAHLVTPST